MIARHGSNMAGRRLKSAFGVIVAATCSGIAASTLLIIFAYVVVQGISAINLPFLVEVPRPVGVPGGGVGNGIVGSVLIVGIAGILATPVGVLTGIFLALFGRSPAVPASRSVSSPTRCSLRRSSTSRRSQPRSRLRS